MEELELAGLADELFLGFQIDQDALINAICAGEIGQALSIFGDAVLHSIGQPFEYMKECMITLFLLGIGAGIIKQLNFMFKDAGMQQVSFWVIYLLLARQLLVLYYHGEEVVQLCLERLISFGNVFVPVFSAALTMSAGKLTGTGYIATLLLVIYVVEQFLLVVMVPLVEAYMLFSILGGLWQKERVEKMLELLEKALGLGFKGMFTAVTGIGLLQSMILPYVDHAKVGAVKKIVDLIPGAGSVAGTTLEMITGSAVLLKNGIGVIGLLLLLLVAAGPLIKVGLICAIMKLAGVVYGLLGEKKMTWCADKLSLAQGYLWKIAGAGLLMFVVWIILAVYTTNQRLSI